MPAYTLGELMSFATTNCGRRSDIAASTVSRLVNEAYQEVWYAAEPALSEKKAYSSTTTGDATVDLPTDFNAPLQVTLIWQPSWSTLSSAYSSHRTLKLTSAADMAGKNSQPSGVPVEVSFFSTVLQLWPSPNSAYSVELLYRSTLTDMSLTTDVPSMESSWRPAILRKAEEKIYAFLQDYTSEQAAAIRYQAFVSGLETTQAKRHQAKMSGMHVTPAYGNNGRRRV